MRKVQELKEVEFKEGDFVYLEWIDSCSHTPDGWTDPKNILIDKKVLMYKSVGLFFKETEWSYVVAQSVGMYPDVQPHIDAVLEVPKVAIEKIVKLKDA